MSEPGSSSEDTEAILQEDHPGSPIIYRKKVVYSTHVEGRAGCAVGENACYINCKNCAPSGENKGLNRDKKGHSRDSKDVCEDQDRADSSYYCKDRNYHITDSCYIGSLKADDVLKNFDGFLSKLSDFRGRGKVSLEQFILQEILPAISVQYKEGSSSNDTLEVLSRLSCTSLCSPKVVKHSLSMLQECVRAEFSKELANAHAKSAEGILRRPLLNESFKGERMHEQRLRLSVYCDSLIVVLLCQVQGFFTYPYNKDDKRDIVQNVVKVIRKRLVHNEYRRKNRLRYAMEMIILTANRLFAKKPLCTQLQKYLEKVLTLLRDGFEEEDVEELVSKLHEAEEGYYDLHVVMKFLKSKMASDSKAFALLLGIIKKKTQQNTRLWKPTKEDWHFVLLSCEILHDIVMNHNKNGTRSEAAQCLVDFHSAKAYLKSPVLRAIIEKYLVKAAFCPDVRNRMCILEARFSTKLHSPLPVPSLKTHVCKLYRDADLEVVTTVFENEDQVVFRGLYRGDAVAIKVLTVKEVSQVYNECAQERSASEKAFQNEIEILQRLNNKHPNVLKLFTANFGSMPYHMITEFMSKENLLDFLKECRENYKLPTYRDLLRMAIDICNGMIFVGENGVVHCQLRAENILLDRNCHCKVTGFYGARTCPPGITQVDGSPVRPGDVAFRWAAPECQTVQACFSVSSDVWAYGVLLYELFTYGCVPYFDKVHAGIQKYASFFLNVCETCQS